MCFLLTEKETFLSYMTFLITNYAGLMVREWDLGSKGCRIGSRLLVGRVNIHLNTTANVIPLRSGRALPPMAREPHVAL